MFGFRILDHLGAHREVAHHPRTGTPVPRALLSSGRPELSADPSAMALLPFVPSAPLLTLGVLLELWIWLDNKEAFAVASGYSICSGSLGL